MLGERFYTDWHAICAFTGQVLRVIEMKALPIPGSEKATTAKRTIARTLLVGVSGFDQMQGVC